jgi:glutaredoxin-related protein
LESKPTKKYEFRTEMCSICLEELPFFMTECGHFFHENCIVLWMKKRENCPNCNHTIAKMRIMKWCGQCRQQLIPPQCFRVNSRRAVQREEMPVFWPTCANCQPVEELIDLKPI